MNGPLPIRYSILLLLLLLGLMAVLAGLWHDIRGRFIAIEAESRTHISAIGNQTSARLEYLHARGDLLQIQRDVKLLAILPNLVRALVVDDQTLIMASTDPGFGDRPLNETPDFGRATTIIERARDSMMAQIERSTEGDRVVGAFPFVMGLQPGEVRSSRVAVLYLEEDLLRPRRNTIALAFQRAGLLALLVALTMLAAWWFLNRIWARRADELIRVTRDMAAGNLDARANLAGTDELADLATAFNFMAGEIKKSNEDLQENNRALEQAIERANQMAQAAEAANVAKSEFLAVMSHELRTPLNGVLGMVEILAMGNLEPAQKRCVEVIRASGQQLLEMIIGVLDYAEIEAGRLVLDQHPFDPRRLLQDVIAEVEPMAQGKGLAFSSQLDANLPSLVAADPLRIRQIVMRLADNAVKFTSQGEIQLRAGLDQDPAGSSRFRIEVSDTGIGIPADRLEAMFEPFLQGDNSSTRQFGGAGLGLAIGRRLAKLMSGTIEAVSEPGKGSTFTLWVPVELSDDFSG